jgi:hypothetical protein
MSVPFTAWSHICKNIAHYLTLSITIWQRQNGYYLAGLKITTFQARSTQAEPKGFLSLERKYRSSFLAKLTDIMSEQFDLVGWL